MIVESCYLNGVRDPNVWIYYRNGVEYSGETNWIFEKHGYGEEFSQTFTYIGEFKNNKWEGWGYLDLKAHEITYFGNFSNGRFDGKGILHEKLRFLI